VALNIKNREVERLATEVSAMMGESKTEAIRRALEERKRRLVFQVNQRDRKAGLLEFMESEIWPNIPKALIGKRPSRAEEDRILGYGKDGI
jgi:antitoxin VapB